MDIQFLAQQESIETLCFHFLLNQNPKSRNLLINSILMQLVSDPNYSFYKLYHICTRIVDDSKSQQSNNSVQTTKKMPSKSIVDKQHSKNIALLLKQIGIKYLGAILKATDQQLEEILQFCSKQAFCALSGNDYIALVSLIVEKCKSPTSKMLEIMQRMILNPKMHVGSYRQVTRHNLFSLTLKIISLKESQVFSSEFIQKILNLLEDEKDPRNISTVFHVYRLLLNKSCEQKIIPLKNRIFSALEVYYPIDFQGDTGKHNIKLHDISNLLDQCLTHPLFAEETKSLLMIKMGATPISKYIPTFISTRNHAINKSSLTFWQNLLLRTAESQYLDEEYPENSQYTLSNLITELLNRLIRVNRPNSIQVYKTVLTWLDNFLIRHVFAAEDNSKYANMIISTLKDIATKCNRQVRYLVVSFVVNSFIQNTKSEGDVLYKLGLLVPILDKQHYHIDNERMGLLILSLKQIFHQAEEHQPKLIVLKIFMLLSKEKIYSKMINQTNIMFSCIQQIQKCEKEGKIAKAYIDFLVQIYSHEAKVEETIKKINVNDVKIYGLLTLGYKKGVAQTQEWAALLDRRNELYERNFKQLVNNIKGFKPEAGIAVIQKLSLENLNYTQIRQICQIVDQKFNSLYHVIEDNALEFFQKYITNYMMLFVMRNRWRPFLTDKTILTFIRDFIIAIQKSQSYNSYFLRAIAFYNKSLQVLTPSCKSELAINQEKFMLKEEYINQIHLMLPIEAGHNYTKDQLADWPTLIHYSWTKFAQVQVELIQLLPAQILMSEGTKILPIVIKSGDIQTLCKIHKNLSEDVIVNEIIPFLINFLEKLIPQTNSEHIVSCNKILSDLEQQSKQSESIKRSLLKSKGKIVINIEQKLLQHRKRRVRQSSRAIFALYNLLK